jgi:hypothetical protein
VLAIDSLKMSRVIVIDEDKNPKKELIKILNCIQSDEDGMVYICKKFKDPRRFILETYFDEVKSESFSLQKLRDSVNTPSAIKQETREEFLRLASTLHDLACELWLAVQ